MDLFNDLPEPTNTAGEEASSDHAANGSENERKKKRAIDADQEQVEEEESAKRQRQRPASRHLARSKAFAAERQGERDSMQDRHVIIEDFGASISDAPADLESAAYYAVFDGHAGARAAHYCAQHMHCILADKLSKAFASKATLAHVEKEMKRHFLETFKQCDEEFLKSASKSKPVWRDGTTATVILILNGTLYSANVGDSKAIICKEREAPDTDTDAGGLHVIELTKEHSACVYEERQRIQKSGGHVRDGRVLGAIEVSRSIGDGPYKAYGLTCTPDMRKCQLAAATATANFKFVILACDGLWKSFSNQEAAKFVSDTCSRSSADYEACCEQLAVQAVKRLSADNVTVLIVAIDYS